MKLQAVIRSKKESNWKNNNDVGVIDGNGHFRFLGRINYYPEEIQFVVAPEVCAYSFPQSDFSSRRQMVAHVKSLLLLDFSKSRVCQLANHIL